MIMRPSRPARVLMTADTVGGVWTYALELARSLGKEGVEVVLATMGGVATPEQRREARAVATLQLHESEYRLPWMEQPWEDVERAGDWLLDLAAGYNPHVIHLNEPIFGSLAWPAPTVAVVHSCVLSWWQSVWNSPVPADWNCYREEMIRGLRGASAVVAPSAWMVKTIRLNYGVEAQVIANGRNEMEFVPGTKMPLVFAAGRLWDPAKNLGALDTVAEGLRWPVYVAGDRRQPGGEAPVSGSHVHLLGRLAAERVASWLRRASIYAFPARYEPFGLSVLEAALGGCALVLGDIASLRQLWDGAAVFVPPDDTQTLRLALEELIDDAGLRQALAMRARRRALMLTPQRMASSYLQLYSNLLQSEEQIARESACAS